MACFSLNEMMSFLKLSMLENAEQVMKNKGYRFSNFINEKEKMNEVADIVVSNNMKSKEFIEFFIAMESALVLYNSPDTKIGFMLKNTVQPNKITVNNFHDLKNIMKEDTLTDFAIIYHEQPILFQHKQYRGPLDTQFLIKFVKKIVAKYGNLDGVHLLITLQGDKNQTPSNLNIQEVHKFLLKAQLKSKGQILIKWNQLNQFWILEQVHPESKVFKTDFKLPSTYWDELINIS